MRGVRGSLIKPEQGIMSVSTEYRSRPRHRAYLRVIFNFDWTMRSVFKSQTTHRTNSLGWAKSDCHTCQSTSRLCDRRRPRCDTCTAQGIICGGYVQKRNGEFKDRRPERESPLPGVMESHQRRRTPPSCKKTEGNRESGRRCARPPNPSYRQSQ